MKPVRVAITARATGQSPALPVFAGGGVPFARGELADPSGLALFRRGTGDALPLQTRVASCWPDRSVKWLFVDTLASLADGDSLELKNGDRAMPRGSLTVSDTPGGTIEVDTGALVFHVRRDLCNVIDRVWLRAGDRKRLVSRGSARGAVVVNSANEEFRSARDRQDCSAEIEECGPVKAVIRCQGRCVDAHGRAIMNVIARVTAWAGLPLLKVTLTTIFVGDPDRDFIKGVGLEMPVWTAVHRYTNSPAGQRAASFCLDGEWKGAVIPPHKEGYLYVCRRDAVSSVINRYWNKDERLTDYGRCAAGVADLSVANHGLTLYQRKFNREWSCEICVDARENSIVAYPFALHWHDLLHFSRGRDDTTSPGQGGEGRPDCGLGSAKSTDFLLHYHSGAFDPKQAELIQARFENPTLLWVDPQQVSASDALGFAFQPIDRKKYAREEAVAERYLDEHISYRDRFGWRGYLNNGDCQRGWSALWNRWSYGFSCDGWLNNELAFDGGYWLMYLRSGERKYYEAAEDLTRHVIDVDTAHALDFSDVHVRRDYDNLNWGHPALRIGGCHRHQVLHWGDVVCPAHTFIEGHLLYYYVSGDRRALDVAKEAGEFFFCAHRGSLTRGMANALRAFTLLYDATGDGEYLEAAREVLEVVLRGQLPEGGWSSSYDIGKDQWATSFNPWMSSYIMHGLHLYHAIVDDDRVKAAFLKAADAYCGQTDPKLSSGLPPVAEKLFIMAYAWRLSGDRKYLEFARGQLDGFSTRIEQYVPPAPGAPFTPIGGPFEILIGQGMPAFLAALEACQRRGE